MKTVVVGASSGLGRCIAIGLGKRGARVALLARRKERLADAAEEAGAGAVAIACDVTEPTSCREAIERAAKELGGIEALVYSTGIGPLRRLVDLDAETWRHAFATNVTGAALVTAAAIPHLTAARGVAAYLTSISASLTPPWPGLAAYAVSKAALDKLVEAWRVEHPAVGFARVIVGNCAGGQGASMTEFNAGWDPAVAAEVMPKWVASGYLAGMLEAEELVRVVDTVLRSGAGASIPSVVVTPRPGA
jgi:NAD(P)-dependent dehydrogenase (short-subunit alcohol dehydrogenase family)